MANRAPRPLPPSLTVPLEGGTAVVSRGALRGRATLRFSRRGNVIEMHADALQLGDLIDALVARRAALVNADTTGDCAPLSIEGL